MYKMFNDILLNTCFDWELDIVYDVPILLNIVRQSRKIYEVNAKKNNAFILDFFWQVDGRSR